MENNLNYDKAMRLIVCDLMHKYRSHTNDKKDIEPCALIDYVRGNMEFIKNIDPDTYIVQRELRFILASLLVSIDKLYGDPTVFLMEFINSDYDFEFFIEDLYRCTPDEGEN